MTITLRPHQQRALDAMQIADKGQVIVPTGGGKTIIMIQHALQLLAESNRTIVVVAPRILLANQLCDEFMSFIDNSNVHVCHAHSGETHYFHSTKPEKIALFANTARAAGESCIIFTTYHSLPKVIDSGIAINCAYFDEAHNSVAKQFFVATAATSMVADRCYFFTATPRISRRHDRSMGNSDVYGGILCNVPAPELIEQGHILPPTIVPFETDLTRNKHNIHDVDADTVRDIIDQIDESHAAKVLVAVPSSRVLGNMIGQTTLLHELTERGFSVMHVTSKFGAIIDGKKVSREVFFDTLTAWGKEDGRKFVVFHYSILSEGINVPGLTHCILLRNLNVVEMAQTIGRVIRLDKDDAARLQSGELQPQQWGFYNKPTGFVAVPVHKTYGKHVIKRLQNVVDAIFVKGIPPLSLVA
jgi:superfamily II DNA or RNA helicase